ncbi:MAG TPA: lipocalin-like domain-containing protein [Syntrophales bacterium]|nr:lipocalin-like domain-containing protein [Syntrophales bacterium]
MLKLRSVAALILILVSSQVCFADDGAKIVGVWKLISFEVEIQATGQKEFVMGKNPTGYAIFTSEGRVWFVLTGEGRKSPKTIQDRAKLLDSLVAYTGTYHLEGDTWITRIDVAWNPGWVGTEQKRFFKVEGDRLSVLTPWRIMPNFPEKGMTRNINIFERVR